jgi:UDP-glucose 4-epimerase
MNKNTILITGGCGYIGSHTILEIIRNTSYEVISIDSYINSSETPLENIFEITGKRIKNYSIDLCNLEATQKIFKENPGIIGVIHFAALKSVPESVSNPIAYYKNNLESLLNIIQCCKESNVRSFIFSSSCSVYGNVTSSPVDELTPLSGPESPYAETKLMGEKILKDVSSQGNLKIVSLRYFNPVGADSSGKLGEYPAKRPSNLVPVITQVAAGIIPSMNVYGDDYDTRDGSCIRDYIHISDIADAHIKAFDYIHKSSSGAMYDLFNLGTGNGVSVLEAIQAFEKASGVKLKYEIVARRPGDIAKIYSDSSKAEKILHWKPRYGIDEMMDTAWKWQKRLTPLPSL